MASCRRRKISRFLLFTVRSLTRYLQCPYVKGCRKVLTVSDTGPSVWRYIAFFSIQNHVEFWNTQHTVSYAAHLRVVVNSWGMFLVECCYNRISLVRSRDDSVG